MALHYHCFHSIATFSKFKHSGCCNRLLPMKERYLISGLEKRSAGRRRVLVSFAVILMSFPNLRREIVLCTKIVARRTSSATSLDITGRCTVWGPPIFVARQIAGLCKGEISIVKTSQISHRARRMQFQIGPKEQ